MNSRHSSSRSFAELLTQRLSRRRVLQAGAALTAGGALLSMTPADGIAKPTLGFRPIEGSQADDVVLPPGYVYDVVARWGDSLFIDVPDLDPAKLAAGVLLEPGAAQRQAGQFGTNCDAIHFFPLDARGERGLLCVNNEYTEDATMFPRHPGFAGALRGEGRAFARQHPEAVAVAKAAQGVSIIEVVRRSGRWSLVKGSPYNRRITAQTPIELGGPARGHELLRTHADPEGVRVLGTFANCAGGRTPWGTYLTAEENVQDYFGNLDELKARRDVDAHVIDAHRRFRMWKGHSLYGWEAVDARFDLAQEPGESFRFGWIVEIDPHDPNSTPIKRTALGRFAHEGASVIVARDGRVVVYMGDDDKFEYVYKFVSRDRFDPKQPAANRHLLDAGTLYVARFDEEGGRWLPLQYDPDGPLNAAAGFRSQAEVLIKARAAADVLGATPMDRPEDFEPNPVTGRIYLACTRNDDRAAIDTTIEYAGREIPAGPNPANPRSHNQWGHIIEVREADDDHTAVEFSWEVFLLGGDPAGGRLITDLTQLEPGKLTSQHTYYAGYKQAAELSAIGSPDNVSFDADGNLWIVTDGAQPGGTNNGCWVCPTVGEERGRLQQFMSGPVGAEICGCEFSPDGETLFLSIQHPGEGGDVANPRSHWPDGGRLPPRSSVIAVRKANGGKIGS